jgi:hypothetical protein
MTLWAVRDEKLTELHKQRLDSEDRLETWIAQDPSLLGMDVLIIGRQVRTSFGKKIDLLAIDDEGNLVIIELKRDMTPREVVAQVLDYASWVNGLSFEEIDKIALEYPPLKKPLAVAFRDHFQEDLPDAINSDHRMLIVASELDDSSERIVQYLSSKHSLDINVVFFTCFQHDGCEFVGRSWLMDPKEVGDRKPPRGKWTEETFFKQLKNDDDKAIVKQLFAYCESNGGEIGWGAGATTGRFSFTWPSICHHSVLSVNTNGNLRFHFGGLRGNVRAEQFRNDYFDLARQLGFKLPTREEVKFPDFPIKE